MAAVFNYTVLFVLTWLPLSTPNVMFEKTQPHTSSHFQSEGTGFGICVYINERKIGKMFCYQDRLLIWLAPRHHRYAHRSTRPQFANDLSLDSIRCPHLSFHSVIGPHQFPKPVMTFGGLRTSYHHQLAGSNPPNGYCHAQAFKT